MKLCSCLSRPLKRLKLMCRGWFLPLLSLTKTPKGGHMEWMSACCDPFMDYCERSVWIVGLVCFLVVILGVSTVVYTFYCYMVPYMWKTQSGLVFSGYFVYGHYLLINICFHYLKGVTTNPGQPPKVTEDDYQSYERKGWKNCYKCDAPKPPRAHHCRICNKCVMKMDHHCPWMFNCVGHYNHRYFMSFVIFMWLGTAFVVHCVWPRIFVTMGIDTGIIKSTIDTLGLRGTVQQALNNPMDSISSESLLVVIIFFVCLGVTAALLFLGSWNAFLISRAETAIEFYVNQRDASELRSMGKKFVNPYNYGFVRNWRIFFGLGNKRSFVRHVLLPSSHTPLSDGMNWNTDTAMDSNHFNNFRTSQV